MLTSLFRHLRERTCSIRNRQTTRNLNLRQFRRNRARRPAGPDHPHEFVIIRTNLGPLSLPFEQNAVAEDKVDVVDEIEEFAPRSSASLTVELTPARYILICNVYEADPNVGSHYKKGMVGLLTVE